MQLTEQQKRFFNTFGYLVMPKLFSAREIGDITAAFETSIQQHGGGNKHDGSQRTMFLGPIERIPAMNTLLDEPRITGLIGSVIGEEFNYCSGDGNYYTGDTGWHPDGNWGELFAIKVAFYLDPVRRDTGALRVIPGSCNPDHLVRKQKIDPSRSKDLFGVEPRDFPGNVALESDPGDVVIFNHDTYHAAFGGSARRRMFTMNCTRRGHDDIGIAKVKTYLSVHTPTAHKFPTGTGMYYQCLRDTAGPERLRHMEQPDRLHDEVFPHHARPALQPA
jgi:hypothetical protein